MTSTCHSAEPWPCPQVLVCAVTDLTGLSTRSHEELSEELYCSSAFRRRYHEWYMPGMSPEAKRNPLLSPLLAPDLSGLPPAFVLTAQVGTVARPGGSRVGQPDSPGHRAAAAAAAAAALAPVQLCPTSPAQWGEHLLCLVAHDDVHHVRSAQLHIACCALYDAGLRHVLTGQLLPRWTACGTRALTTPGGWKLQASRSSTRSTRGAPPGALQPPSRLREPASKECRWCAQALPLQHAQHVHL